MEFSRWRTNLTELLNSHKQWFYLFLCNSVKIPSWFSHQLQRLIIVSLRYCLTRTFHCMFFFAFVHRCVGLDPKVYCSPQEWERDTRFRIPRNRIPTDSSFSQHILHGLLSFPTNCRSIKVIIFWICYCMKFLQIHYEWAIKPQLLHYEFSLQTLRVTLTYLRQKIKYALFVGTIN